MNIWTLITTLGDGSGSITNGHPDASLYGGTFTFAGTLTGNNVYAICSLLKPQNDSSGVAWQLGAPNVVAAGYVPSTNTIPTCTALQPCCDHVLTPVVVSPILPPPSSGSIVYSEKIYGCDDINNDGSVIVHYWTIVWIDTSGSVVASATFNESLSAPYTPIHPVSCSASGIAPTWAQRRIRVDDANTWSPSATTTAYTIRVYEVGGTKPTFTDSLGIVTSVELNEIISYSNDNTIQIDTSAIYTSTTGSKAIITYIENI